LGAPNYFGGRAKIEYYILYIISKMTTEYIISLSKLSEYIYKLPKLSKKDICLNQHSDYEKIILFGFYEYYDELDKFDINQLIIGDKNKWGTNILFIAAYYNKIRLIKYLLARGININISNNEGFNAYISIFFNENVKIKTLKLLEDNGTNIHIITKALNNAFTTFIINNKRPQIKVLEHLKSIGIDIHKVNMWRNNVCFYAEKIKTIKYFEANGINIHLKNIYNINIYSKIIKYSYQIDKNILKYLKSRGVRNYYSENYNYCKRENNSEALKYLIKSNCNNRFKNITCYI